MSNVWRRQPGRLTSSDLLKKWPSGASQSVADDFFEASAGPAIVTGTATLAASGDLSGSALLFVLGVGTQPGTGTLSATALLQVLGASTLAGGGSLTAQALNTVLATAQAAGQGTLTASGEILGVVSGNSTGRMMMGMI